jgi:hypothetical protein
MSTSTITRQRRFVTAGFATCLAAGAASLAFGSGVTQTASPEPVAATPTASQAALPPSPPDRITIERLKLAAQVVELRAAADGKTLTLPPLDQTGWDATSVTPGEPGITVVTGYIARTPRQPGALKGLGRLHDGDVVTVERKDRKEVHYRVTAIDYYAQGAFPATRVFAKTNRPELRLISTGGPLRKGDPLGNAVVTAVAVPGGH